MYAKKFGYRSLINFVFANTDNWEIYIFIIRKQHPLGFICIDANFGLHITSNQQRQMFVQIHNTIVSKPNVSQGQILYCTTDCIRVDMIFQENFSTNIKVRKRLSHRNDCRQRRVIWVTYRCHNRYESIRNQIIAGC